MDVLDLVSWVREHNWAIVIGYRKLFLFNHFKFLNFVLTQRYREAEYNVFNIDETDPWRHKWVPDVGRIPARKPSVSLRSFGHHKGRYT